MADIQFRLIRNYGWTVEECYKQPSHVVRELLVKQNKYDKEHPAVCPLMKGK